MDTRPFVADQSAIGPFLGGTHIDKHRLVNTFTTRLEYTFTYTSSDPIYTLVHTFTTHTLTHLRIHTLVYTFTYTSSDPIHTLVYTITISLSLRYGVASVRKIDKIVSLFCKRAL